MSQSRDNRDAWLAQLFSAEIPSNGDLDLLLPRLENLTANDLLLVDGDLILPVEHERFLVMNVCSLGGDCKGELLAETRKLLVLLLLSALGSLYTQSGGSGDLLGGPSGRVTCLEVGELLGVDVEGEVTNIFNARDGKITGTGMWFGKDDNESVTGVCLQSTVSCSVCWTLLLLSLTPVLLSHESSCMSCLGSWRIPEFRNLDRGVFSLLIPLC